VPVQVKKQQVAVPIKVKQEETLGKRTHSERSSVKPEPEPLPKKRAKKVKKFVEIEAEEDDESEEFAEAPAEEKYTEEELAPRAARLTS